MPEAYIPCPECSGPIKVRNSGPLVHESRTGLLCRECLVVCKACGRKGKMLVTLDIALYLDAASETLHVEPTPFPTTTAA